MLYIPNSIMTGFFKKHVVLFVQYLKPLKKGKTLHTNEMEFFSFWAQRKDYFQKVSKTDLPFRFCKTGLQNTLFIFGRKMVVCFVLFLNTSSNFDFLKFKIEAQIDQAEKDSVRKRFTGFIKMQLT